MLNVKDHDDGGDNRVRLNHEANGACGSQHGRIAHNRHDINASSDKLGILRVN